jgi:predicted transcriptional regulator
MGEKPTGRLFLIAGLLMASLLVGFSSASLSDVRLEIEVSQPEGQPWYDVNQPLIITPTLYNDGNTDVIVPMNPACTFVLNVYNQSDVMVVDGDALCPNTEQGQDIFAGDSYRDTDLEWSMKDADGAWLESGTYTVELMHTKTGLSKHVVATVQTPVVLPQGLTYSVEWIQRTTEANGSWVGLVSLHNPSAHAVDLHLLPACVLEVQLGASSQFGAPCFGDVETLMPGEVMLVDQLVLTPQASMDVRISTPGKAYVHAQSLEGLGQRLGLQATPSLVLNTNDDQAFGQGEILISELLLTSTSVDDQTMLFTSTCKAELWVVNDLGHVVFDSRADKTCQPIELESSLESNTPMAFTLPQWGFFDNEGCRVQPGTYTIIAELPEYNLATLQTVKYRDAESNPCTSTSTLTLEATSSWLDDETLLVSTVVSNQGDAAYLRMVQPCTYAFDFVDASGASAHRLQALCNEYDGRKVLVPNGEAALMFDVLEIEMVQDGQSLLPDGFYTLQVTMLASSDVVASMDLSWPQGFTEPPVHEPEEEQPVLNTYEITGTWMGLLTEVGTCYVMDISDTTVLLSNARTLSSWTPNGAMQGIYKVVDTTASPACAGFSAPSVEVVEVVMEQPLAQEPDEPAAETVLIEETSEVAFDPVVPVITVVVTASLLSFLGIMVATNEGFRLPATMAGLWFIGLLGKTHETTDGRYQRGRLMGYLTANPGCHFRALMGALDMSNGQITHHLRVLEAEENVWRKNDGRLVRFYPLTNQLHPNTAEDDLPVPPLSPDPNSLQGKILNLLDHDGELGQFPTQAELAKRLEKSQQLISHHLRTLQKYGLVERRKMGVMNRYKLTREAIFLLETSDDFSQK